MHLELAVLADAINTTGAGKLNILGEFNQISAKSLPAIHRSLMAVVRVAGGPEDVGQHHVLVSYVTPNGPPRPILDSNFDLASAGSSGVLSRTALILTVETLLLESPGAHRFDVTVDGRLLGSIPLHVADKPD